MRTYAALKKQILETHLMIFENSLDFDKSGADCADYKQYGRTSQVV